MENLKKIQKFEICFQKGRKGILYNAFKNILCQCHVYNGLFSRKVKSQDLSVKSSIFSFCFAESGDSNLPTPPVFNLGRSLKNLYCKGKEDEPEENEAMDKVDTGEREEEFGLSLDSALLRKVKVYKPLKRNHSLPELSNYASEMSNIDKGFNEIAPSSSITNLSRNWKQANLEMEKSPGYAFLTSVAENLRGKQAKTMVLRADMGIDKAHKKQSTDVKALDTMNIKVTKDKPTKDEVKIIPETISPINITKEKPKQSVFASVYNWGTKSKTFVSNKEINMYSPLSF